MEIFDNFSYFNIFVSATLRSNEGKKIPSKDYKLFNGPMQTNKERMIEGGRERGGERVGSKQANKQKQEK